MLRATHNGWILETAASIQPGVYYGCRAWVSDPQRYTVGYAFVQGTEADAVRRALIDAGHHYRTDPDAIAGLEREYFGPTGMLATRACENSGE